MAAIALTIIILLNYLAFYYTFRAFKGSVRTKKKRFVSRQKSRRCVLGGGGGGVSNFTIAEFWDPSSEWPEEPSPLLYARIPRNCQKVRQLSVLFPNPYLAFLEIIK